MPFTIDPKLIENDEVRLTENSSGNLEIVHVPSGKSLEIDASEQTSSIGGGSISASDITDVSADSDSDAHHSKTTSASELTDVSPDSTSNAHHSRYSDVEAVSAVESDGTLAINITGNADEVDGFDIQKNGSDTTGVINFKT
jgi:hypothetical protein